MKNYIRSLQSVLYRMVHSKQLLLHLGAPFLGAVVFCAYYMLSAWRDDQKILAYFQVTAMVFPLLSAIAVSMLYEAEAKAGSFYNVLSVPYSKQTAHLAQCTALFAFCAAAVTLAVMGFGLLFYATGGMEYPLGLYAMIAGILFLSNLAGYLVEYMICFIFGSGAVLFSGILGTLLSGLLILGLGDVIWRFIPFAYGIRIVTGVFTQMTKTYFSHW